MTRWLIDGRVGKYGQLVVHWKDGRIISTRFPIDDLDVYADEVAMFRRDRHVRSIEHVVDGVVLERTEGVYSDV